MDRLPMLSMICNQAVNPHDTRIPTTPEGIVQHVWLKLHASTQQSSLPFGNLVGSISEKLTVKLFSGAL